MARIVVRSLSRAMPTQQQAHGRVAVVGLGIAGLAAVKNLVEQGFEDVVGYERNDYVGGLWQFNPDPKQTTVLRTTKMNGSKQFSAYQDFPFPDEMPDYPSATQVAEHMRAYASHFDLNRYFCFNTTLTYISPDTSPATVSSVTSSSSSSSSEFKPVRWRLRLKDKEGERVEVFDRVIITSGPWGKTWMPTLPGMDEFQGSIMHAQAYKGPEPFQGKRVVVIGMGSTATDTVVDLVGSASEVYMSHRSGGRILRRYPKGSKTPLDHRITRRSFVIGSWLGKTAPNLANWAVNRLVASNFKKNFPGYNPEWGFFPSPPLGSAGGAIQDDLMDLMIDGKIKNLHGIKRFNKNSVITADKPGGTGEIETACDVVIFAVSYSTDFSICSPEADPTRHSKYPEWDALGDKNNQTSYPRLHQTFFHLDYPESLTFVGACRGFSFAAFSNVDLASQAIAQVWKGAWKLPPRDEQEKWLEQMYDRNMAFAKAYSNTKVSTYAPAFERWLNDAVGNQVNEKLGWGWEGWKFWWNEHKLYKLIVDGINTPFVYRLWDARAGSRKKWDGALAEIYKCNGLKLPEP